MKHENSLRFPILKIIPRLYEIKKREKLHFVVSRKIFE
jgi:hypothetical protein